MHFESPQKLHFCNAACEIQSHMHGGVKLHVSNLHLIEKFVVLKFCNSH